MTPITLPSGKFLIVDVHEGASNFDLVNVNGDNILRHNKGNWMPVLPPGSYTLIGVEPLNLTESEWKGIVESLDQIVITYYVDYLKKGNVCFYAKESGSSLLTANGHKQGSAVILKVND